MFIKALDHTTALVRCERSPCDITSLASEPLKLRGYSFYNWISSKRIWLTLVSGMSTPFRYGGG